MEISLLLLLVMFLLAAGVLWLGERVTSVLRRERRAAEQLAAEEVAYVERLRNPRWEEVERISGGRPSPALLDLYSDATLITEREFDVWCDPEVSGSDRSESINMFCPADRLSMEDSWCRHLPAGSFPFARDVYGDLLFVELTPDGRDGPVRHWYHDGGDIEEVASTLETFVKSCRQRLLRDA